MFTIDIHTESRDKAIVGLIKHIQETLVERQSGTKHRCYHHILLRQGDVEGAERRGNGLRLILQGLRQFVSHNLTDTHDVVAEEKTVSLVILVTQLRHILIENRVALAEINNFHK